MTKLGESVGIFSYEFSRSIVRPAFVFERVEAYVIHTDVLVGGGMQLLDHTYALQSGFDSDVRYTRITVAFCSQSPAHIGHSGYAGFMHERLIAVGIHSRIVGLCQSFDPP